MKRWYIVLFIVGLAGSSVVAEETLSQWADAFNTPDTQYKILQHIFPEGLASASSGILDPSQVTMLFSRENSWVQLTREYVWISSATAGQQPILIVTCLIRKAQDQPPINANTYVFRDASEKPYPISGGYENRDHVRQVALPKLNRSFILMESLTLDPKGTVTNETAVLYRIDPTQTGNPLHSVWISRASKRYFHLGFAELHAGGGEDLILKETAPPPPKGAPSSLGDIWGDTAAISAPSFTAYRWSEDHFVEDDQVFDSQFKSLPDSTWRY